MFGRKKKADVEDQAAPEEVDADLVEVEEEDPVLDEWEEFDLSKDWREDGPFDIDEVDLDADEVKRRDLGAMILTLEKGMTLTLVANQAKEILHARVGRGTSIAELTVYAAPSTSNYRAVIRDTIIDAGNARDIKKVKGPFGTELRRVLVSKNQKGREVLTPVRDWLIEGPRWVLGVRLSGPAGLAEGGKDAAIFEEFVRNIIVRRGDVAMVPGTAVPLTREEK